MANFRNIIAAAVGVLAVGVRLTAGEKICESLPARSGVGRSSSMPYDAKADWCPNQIKTCGFICGGKTSSNSCDLLSTTRACYSCTCADGSTPQLDLYWNTIPSQSCQQERSNCAASPTGSFSGLCNTLPKCGDIYLTEPIGAEPLPASDLPLPTLTYAPEPVAVTTEPAPETTTTTLTSTVVESEVVATVSIIQTSHEVSPTTTWLSSTTSSIETSKSVTFVPSANSTTTIQTSTFSSSRVSSTVSTTFLQAGAMKTSFPWAKAAIGVAGFVAVGQL